MMSKIAHVAVVAALLSAVNADAATLRSTKTAQAPWQLSKVQPKVNLQEEVQMNIGLKRKNIDQLEKILLEVSDPKSSRYGDHLSETQLRNLVGSSPASVEEVKAWLTANGVPASQVTVSAHMDAIKFTATRAQVASLLKVEWSTYDNTLSKQTSVRALGAIQIPDALQGVVEVVAGHRGWPMQMMPKKASISDNANITPKKIYEVYQETEIPTTPAGQTNIQSFFQAQGQAVKASDLTSFCSQYLSQPGFSGACKIAKYVGGTDPNMPGIESSLDSQYITSTSYGADTWAYTYSGTDFCSDLLSWAQDVFGESGSPHPNVISMSYGSQSMPTYCTGQGAQRLHEDTMKMGAAGISVLIASGDMGSGLYSREGYNNGNLNPSFPAELPYVTSVGSTTFVAGNSGTQRAVSFSGGGFSWTWEAPSYQKAAIHEFLTTSTQLPTLGKYNKTGRGTPMSASWARDSTSSTVARRCRSAELLAPPPAGPV
jgi:tripeptidyl-peptidase-1